MNFIVNECVVVHIVRRLRDFCKFSFYLRLSGRRCTVKNPETMFVEWFKDDLPLEHFIDLSRRTAMDQEGSITINPTQMSDLGQYKCKIRSLAGDEQLASAYINVQCK